MMKSIKIMNPYKTIYLQFIHPNRMTMRLLIGLLTINQGSIAHGVVARF